MTARPIQLGHVNIFVRDPKRSEEFYATVFGLTVQYRRNGTSFMSANEGLTHEIALVGVSDQVPGPEKPRVGLNHIAWQMASFQDLKDVYRRLKEYGAEILRIGDHNVSLGVYFQDPDGNGNEVYYELPRNQWPAGENGEIFNMSRPFPWSLEDDSGVEPPQRELALT